MITVQTAKRPELTGCSFDDVEAGDILITPVTKFLVTEKEHIRFNGSSSLKKGYHLTLGDPNLLAARADGVYVLYGTALDLLDAKEPVLLIQRVYEGDQIPVLPLSWRIWKHTERQNEVG